MSKQVGISQQVNPIEYLISGPLQAMVKADALATQSTLQLVSEIGFEKNEDVKKSQAKSATTNLPQLRMFEFSYSHPIPDPSNPGSVIETPTHVKVPLLSLITLPHLSISEATIDLNIKVIGFSPSERAEAKKGPLIELPPVVHGIYTQRTSKRVPITEEDPQRSAQEEPHTLAISINLKRQPAPEAEKRIFSLLQDSLVSSPIKQKITLRPEDVSKTDARRILKFLNTARTAKAIASAIEIEGERDIGLNLAQNIIAERTRLGKFENLEQVLAVPQIGPERFTEIIEGLRKKQKQG